MDNEESFPYAERVETEEPEGRGQKGVPGLTIGPDTLIEWIRYFPPEQLAIIGASISAAPAKISIEKNSRGYTFGVEVRQQPGETTVHAEDRAREIMTWLELHYGGE